MPILSHEGVLLLGVALVAWLSWSRFTTAAVLVTAFIPTYLLRLTLGGIPTNFFELASLAVVIVSLWRHDTRQWWREMWTALPWPLLLMVVAWLVSAVIATALSAEVRVSLGILKGWIIVPLVWGGVVLMSTRTAAMKLAVVQALLWSGTFVSAWALLQLGHLPRLIGPYDVPNSLALWLVPLWVMAVWLYLPAQRWWQYLPITLIGLAILGTLSVGATLASFIALLLGVALWRRVLWRRAAFYGIAALVGVTLVFFGTGRLTYLLSPLTSGHSTSWSVRWQLWSVAGELIYQHPFVGVGLGQFEPHYQRVLHERFQHYKQVTTSSLPTPYSLQPTPYPSPPIPEFVFRDPHNWILSMWLNVGVLGLIAFSAVQVYVLAQAFRDANLRQQPVQQALILALVSLLVFGLVDTIYWKNDLAIFHWMLLAWLFVLPTPAVDRSQVP